MKPLGKFIRICGLTAALSLAAFSGSIATTYYISTGGSDSNNGTSQSTPFASIGKGVSSARAGDTIDVDSGTFNVSTPIVTASSGTSGSPITLQTTPGDSQAVINGNGVSGGLGDVIDIENDYWTINNLTLQGGGGGNFEDVDIYSGNHCTLENSLLEYGEWGGADISRYDQTSAVTDDHITGCIFYDNSTVNTGDPGTTNWGGGVGLNNCTSSSITNCTVYDNWGEGLTVAGSNTASGSNTVTGNTVYDNFSVELYLNCANGATVANNLVYTETTAFNRSGQGQAIGLAIDNEGDNANPALGDPYPTANCNLYNNIIINGARVFRYANTNTYSGFYNGGLNGYRIYNNVFYAGSNGNNVDVQIDNDSGHNFIWRNNVSWQANNGTDVSDDGGGGTQTLSNNCWDFSGGANGMSGTSDVTDANTNPGVAGGASVYAASYWKPISGSGLNSSGYNAYSTFTYDYSNSSRPSSGAWSIGPYIAFGGGGGGGDLVQENYNDPGTSPTSVTGSYNSSQTSGDLNVVVIGYNNTTATVTSVSDSKGNTYTKAIGPTVGSLASQYIYYAPNIASGSNTVTVNFSASVNYPDLRIAEYKNVGALDKTAGAGGSSASPSSGSATTTSANEVLVGACNSGPGVTGAGSGYGDLVITSPDGDAIEDDTVTSTGSYSASASQSSGNWVMQMATFEAASSAPGTPTLNSATVGNGSVALAWATDSGASTYSVYRGTSSNGESGTAIASGISTTSYTDSTVSNGTTYYYKIKATNGSGTSGYSNEKSARPVAPIALKQDNYNNPTSGTTVTCAFGSSQTAGDMNVVAVGSNSPTATISSVTDTQGNTYTKGVGMTASGGTEQSIYYAPSIKAGSNTVSVTFNTSVGYPDVRITEFSGVYSLDKTAAAAGTGSSASSGSATTTQTRELLFAATDCYPTTTGFGSGYTDIWPSTGDTDGNSAAYDSVSSTGSYSGAATLSGSNYWVIQLVTLY